MTETLLAALANFGGAARPIAFGRSTWSRWTAAVVAAIGFGDVASADVWPSGPADPVTDRPIEVPDNGYITSDTCRACHPSEYASWRASWHRTMTQVVSPESVFGDFDDVDLEIRGKQYRMFREGDEFWADFPVDAPDGDAEIRKRVQLVMSTGSHHMQVYWYSAGVGRGLGMLPLYYLKKAQKWIPWSSAFLRKSFDHGQEDLGRWNGTCQKCHTINPRPRLIDAAKREPRAAPDTEVSEFGIACEACHGPAEGHVTTNRNPVNRYRHHLDSDPDTTVVNPIRLNSARASDVCGQCHGVTAPLTPQARMEALDGGTAFRPGADLSETRAIPTATTARLNAAILKEDPKFLGKRYWTDGMIRVGGREYNALLDTPCYAHGDESKGVIQCTSCHQLHKPDADPRSFGDWSDDQLDAAMRTNTACLQCHDTFASQAALKKHTHHEAGSSGSLCYNCHMPFTAWGLLKATRSHQISNPTVTETVATGRPNACNGCHLDRTLAWTADKLSTWYGTVSPELPTENKDVPAAIVAALSGDAGQRALAAWAMGWRPAMEASGSGWRERVLAPLLLDPYDAVRFNAARSLKRQPGFAELEYDFLAPDAAREAIASGVTQTWRAAGKDPIELTDERFQHLLRNRDERDVHLVE